MFPIPDPPPRARLRLAAVTDLFASPLRASHYLELVNPLWASHRLRARVVAVADEAAGARTLTLRPGRGWRRHTAGQHVQVGVLLGGRQHTRSYSIVSEPERADRCIAITVKAIPGGRVSAHLVRHVGVGDRLTLTPPQGDFVLPDAVPVRPLFVTAGSGLTPIMSMLRSFAARGDLPSIVHLHYAPRPEDVLFAAELAALARAHPRYRLAIVTTRTGGAPSHFGPAQLAAHCPDWADRDVWACGPEPLLAAVEAHWHAAGLPGRVRLERFHHSVAGRPAGVSPGRVRFGRSGLAVATDGRTSLLRVAEDAGLAPPYGCRMGICHTCDARLVAGCARDLRTGALVDEPGAMVQICVSASAGDVELAL